MDHRPSRRVIGLHQGEGRARRLQIRGLDKRADQTAGESRLSGAEIAAQRDEIARLEPGCLRRGEAERRCLIRRFERPNSRRRQLRQCDCSCAVTAPIEARPGSADCEVVAAAAIGSIGKMQVTVVPSLGAVSISTRPRCNSTSALTIDRPRPGPRWREPLGKSRIGRIRDRSFQAECRVRDR